MAVRLSGLSSGLDTESIIKELMSVQSMKKTKVQNKLTKLEWKEDKWKALNTKIYNLYREELAKFKTQGSYLTKSVTCTDATKATFSASSVVPAGTHTLDITHMASAQFITGNKFAALSAVDMITRVDVTSDTKITSLPLLSSNYVLDGSGHRVQDPGTGQDQMQVSAGYIIEGTVLSLKLDKDAEASTYKITERTTLSDLTSWFKSKGVSFNYDSQSERFFLSSMQSGLDNSFTLTSTTDLDTTDDYNDTLLYNVGYQFLSDTSDEYTELKANLDIYFSNTATPEEKAAAQEKLSAFGRANQRATEYLHVKYIEDQFKEIMGDNKNFKLEWNNGDWSIEKANDDVKESSSTYRNSLRAKDVAYNKETIMKDHPDYKSEYQAVYAEEYRTLKEQPAPANDPMQKVFDAVSDSDYSVLNLLGIGEITGDTAKTSSAGSTILNADDMVCVYNGSQYTSASNTIKINGLTINAIDVTTTTLKINISNDVEEVYKNIKDFIKKYNEVLKEVNDTYYAANAKGYDILTEEERDHMTDEQIDKWENKIKDSLLRRDDTLQSVMTALRSLPMLTSKYEGEEYSLLSFNITTSNYTEKGLLHIYGDPEDSAVADEKDKLKAAIEEDPDKIMKIFSDIGTQLYNTLAERMAPTKLSSALTFYNDKEITSMKKDYKDELDKWDSKLKDMENRYYKKFTAMETAMSKLNSQTSYITSLFGGGN